jgi:hypothetical protein
MPRDGRGIRSGLATLGAVPARRRVGPTWANNGSRIHSIKVAMVCAAISLGLMFALLVYAGLST